MRNTDSAAPPSGAGYKVALTLSSGILLPLALPNELITWGATIPGLVALVPILLVVYAEPSRKAASRWGALFGVVSTAIANYWLAFFGEFSVWTIGGVVVVYAGYNFLLFGFLHLVVHKRALSPFARPLRIAVIWTAYEYLKSVGFLGYP